jgi:catechol 2,3-dioxygenase-like lactoylglutathione lyase family enzyme
MSTTARLAGRLHLVMVPSADQQRSVAFYEALGFEKRVDFPFGEGHRWLELYPPDGTAGIALTAAAPGATGVQTGLILTTDDIDAAHAQLRAGGADVDAAVAREGAPTAIRIGADEIVGPFPPMFYVRDPDGNALMIVG